jgi:hypothetical protein
MLPHFCRSAMAALASPDMRLGCRMHPLILFESAATHSSLSEVARYCGMDLNASVSNAHPF